MFCICIIVVDPRFYSFRLEICKIYELPSPISIKTLSCLKPDKLVWTNPNNSSCVKIIKILHNLTTNLDNGTGSVCLLFLDLGYNILLEFR